MKNLFVIFLLTILMSACGKSPFLDSELSEKISSTSQSLQSGSQNGLTFPVSKKSIKTYWRENPSVGVESKLLIVILNEDLSVLSEDIDIRVKLWMPTMGHGSYPVTVKKVESGVYEASEMFFTMPGLWDIHFQIYENEQLQEEVLWPLNL